MFKGSQPILLQRDIFSIHNPHPNWEATYLPFPVPTEKPHTNRIYSNMDDYLKLVTNQRPVAWPDRRYGDPEGGWLMHWYLCILVIYMAGHIWALWGINLWPYVDLVLPTLCLCILVHPYAFQYCFIQPLQFPIVEPGSDYSIWLKYPSSCFIKNMS